MKLLLSCSNLHIQFNHMPCSNILPITKCFQFSFKLCPDFYSWNHPQLSTQWCSSSCQSQSRISSSQRCSFPISILLISCSRPCSHAIQDHTALSLLCAILVRQSFHEIPLGNVPFSLLWVLGFSKCQGVPGANYQSPRSLCICSYKHHFPMPRTWHYVPITKRQMSESKTESLNVEFWGQGLVFSKC